MQRFVLFLLLNSALFAAAQEKPEAPKPKTDRKVFFAGVSLLAAAKTADAVTTLQLLDRGGWENNPLFGRYPSPAKQSLINLGIFGAQAGVFYLTEHNRHAWVRWTGRAFIGHAILEHSRLAACNAGIDTRSPELRAAHTILKAERAAPDSERAPNQIARKERCNMAQGSLTKKASPLPEKKAPPLKFIVSACQLPQPRLLGARNRRRHLR